MDNRLMLLSYRAILILYKIVKRKCIIMSKRLVAYFSASGVTAKVAENLADAIGADIFEIQLKVSYTKADLNWMDKKVRSTIEMSAPTSRPAIAAKRDNMDEYDIIFVGLSLRHLLFNLVWHVDQAKSVEQPIDIRHTPDISQRLGSVHYLSDFTDIVIRQHHRTPSKALAFL